MKNGRSYGTYPGPKRVKMLNLNTYTTCKKIQDTIFVQEEEFQYWWRFLLDKKWPAV